MYLQVITLSILLLNLIGKQKEEIESEVKVAAVKSFMPQYKLEIRRGFPVGFQKMEFYPKKKSEKKGKDERRRKRMYWKTVMKMPNIYTESGSKAKQSKARIKRNLQVYP